MDENDKPPLEEAQIIAAVGFMILCMCAGIALIVWAWK